MGALFMVLWCWHSRTPIKLGPGQLRLSLIAGFLLFIQIATFNVSIEWSNSSHASILINTFVFWVLAIEHFVTRTDRLTSRKIVGLAVASVGVLTMLSIDTPHALVNGADQPSLAGDLLMVLSAFLLAVRIVFVKYALRRIEPGKLILWHDVFGVVLFAAYSLLMEHVVVERMPLSAILGLAYQGILVAGLCFALQAHLLRKHSASQISMFSFSTPLFGVLFAAVFRDDPLSCWLLVAGICIAGGIYVVSTRPRNTKTDYAS
jgi:drug/metabolite transporter (DMT)-like permease